ncbi:MAG: DUF4159 domain-containing protein, partial [Pseudomonadota bacterium]
FTPLSTEGMRLATPAAVPLRLGGWILAIAAALLMIDLLVMLRLRGRLPGPAGSSIPKPMAAALVAMAAILLSEPVTAQTSETGQTQLAYIAGTSADATVAAGLEALSTALTRRTSVAAGPVAGVAADAADLGRYPLVYWPAYARTSMTPAEADNLRRYVQRGGLILFDFGRPLGAGSGARRLLSPLGLPSLAEADADHVLFKSYYLLDTAGGGALWVDAGTDGDSGRVSGTVLGGGNWASSWSGAVGRSPSQRENALRFGINLVIYALTGTYKADQVHTETLLDRIGGGE